MFVTVYLIAGLAWTLYSLIMMMLAKGTEFVDEFFGDLSGVIAMVVGTIAWPVMVGMVIWTAIKNRRS